SAAHAPQRSAAARTAGLSRVPAAAVAGVGEASLRESGKPGDARDGLMAYSRIRIEDASHHAGEPVEIAGWLYNLRKSGKIVFPLLRDGTGLMQAVAVKNALPEAVFEEIKGLTQESSIILTGKIRKDDRAPGGYEMDVEGIETIQRVSESDPYPITPKEHGVDFLM